MARIMLMIKILLIYQIFLVVDSTNNTTTVIVDGTNNKTPVVVDSTNNKTPVVVDIKNRFFEVATRIIGGEPADIKDYPFTVSVQWRLGSRHHCGGSYILPRFILSAAHCMVRYNGFYWHAENPRFYLVLAGTSNLWYSPTWQIAVTDAVLPHPQFTYGTMAHDIGLFRIAKPLRLTPYVNYVPIPHEYDRELFTRKNQSSCTVIGWGKTSESSPVTSNTLQHVDVPLMTPQECRQYFSHTLHGAQICAGKKEGGVDACQGDSGGPLICNGILTGIVSWGYGCAAANSPGVYCRVDQYLDWIKQISLKNNAHSNNAQLNVPFIGLIIAAGRFFT